MPSHTILLIGDGRMAFPAARALSRAGHTVHAGVSIYSNYLEWSRYVAKSFPHPPLEPGTDDAKPKIDVWLAAHDDIDTLLPVSEAGLRFLTRHRKDYERRFALMMPASASVETASDKAAMFDLVQSLDLPLAAFRAVTDLPSTRAAAEAIGFPLIIKPSKVDAPLFERKALILRSAAEFEQHFSHWPDDHPELLVQAFVAGPRHSVVFSASCGQLLGAVEICAARTHENDGTGYTTYGITVPPTPAVQRSVEALVSALDYSSTGCAQFIVSPDRQDVTFMEINPRVSLTRIAECAGLAHTLWALDLAHGRSPLPGGDPWTYPAGVEYVWTKGDLTLLASLVRHGRMSPARAAGRLGRIGSDALRCHHAVFDAGDPLPAMGVYFNKVISPFRSGRYG